ncbi:MAG: hypothetical protein IPI97_12665 [Nitrosomonas sp.]|nr:hypothetical protein [Nitrosomonas sp.]
MSCSPTKPNAGTDASKSCDDPTKRCPLEVTVAISLSASVACPGHPLAITATGSPSGGTYSWTVSGGGAKLVDGSGNPVSTGSSVNLRSFQPDNTNGNILAQSANLQVTYTHPNGTATDSKTVPIHKIDFVVTNTAIHAGVTQANEMAGQVNLGNAAGIDTMVTDPRIEIQLDASCPRKSDCAKNHRVGWIQNVLTNDRRIRYTHTLIQVTVALPIRDGDEVTPVPWYDVTNQFTADRDKQTAHHFDSPGNGASWLDPRPAAPAPPPAINRQLRQIFFSNSFHAWLVVQNIEWEVHDRDNSFVFLRNFAWSMQLNVTVDTTQPVTSRCTPASRAPTIGALGKGRGPIPVLTEPFPNRDHTVTSTAAPGI